MTAAVFIDPLVGAALVHLGLPILPGLPCPTCGGTGWRCRNSNLMCTHRVHQGCPACNGSGVWTPPDSPVPIGVTARVPMNSERWGDDWFVWEPPYGVGPILCSRQDDGAMHPIVLSSMIGEGTLRPLKVSADDAPERPGVRIVGESLWLLPELTDTSRDVDISSALPFLPGLKPGDTVYLADGFTESVECPECEGRGYVGEYERHRCDRCWGSDGRLSCPFPVDAPDHPCVVTS